MNRFLNCMNHFRFMRPDPSATVKTPIASFPHEPSQEIVFTAVFEQPGLDQPTTGRILLQSTPRIHACRTHPPWPAKWPEAGLIRHDGIDISYMVPPLFYFSSRAPTIVSPLPLSSQHPANTPSNQLHLLHLLTHHQSPTQHQSTTNPPLYDLRKYQLKANWLKIGENGVGTSDRPGRATGWRR